MKKQKRLWKSLKLREGKIVSDYDKSGWTIGDWRTVCEPTELCKGLNCSEKILDAIGFVKPDIIAEVEVFGKCLKDDDKYTCERMRIIHAWITPPKLYAEMAIFAAEQVLQYYETRYPQDNRPREAIKKAKECVAAVGTYAAHAAHAAAHAAHAAAYAAAHAAAYDAAAHAAAHAAAYDAAAHAAAHATIKNKEKARTEMRQRCEQWLIDHITELQEMT